MLARLLVQEMQGIFVNSYAVEESGCHRWTGRNYGRYGRMYVPYLRESLYAHRVAMMLGTGKKIPKGKFVCHKCDNMLCVNIEHLFIGTSKDNQQDMKRKGRSLAGTKNGHHTLVESEILSIYEAVDTGATYKSQAKKYKVSATHIRRIALGVSWEHLHKQRYPA